MINQYADWLRAEIDYWERYHNHKETMAWLATAFYLSGIIVLAFELRHYPLAGPLPGLIFVALFVTILCFLKMQFSARYRAHTKIIGLRWAMAWLLDSDHGLPPEYQKIVRGGIDLKRGWYPKFIQDKICDAEKEECRVKFPGFRSEVATYLAVFFVTILAIFIVWHPPCPTIRMEVPIIGLLAAGFGLLVLGLNVMMVWRLLRVGGAPSPRLTEVLVRGGLGVFGVGFAILLFGIFYNQLSTPESAVILTTGVSVTSLGFAWLLQGWGFGRQRIVYAGAWLTTGIGVGLILAYSLALYVFHCTG